jgi:2-polyprenyl-6-methoxyphenol hydroxylase-like FAD-dependent oxidoreductase
MESTGGRYVTIPRGALSRLLVEKITGSAEIILEDEIHTLRECEDCVEVELAQTKTAGRGGGPTRPAQRR